MIKIFSAAIMLTILLWACGKTPEPIPKPRVYPKVEYPEKSYHVFEQNDCPFTFDIPNYAEVIKDKYFFGEAPPHSCWFDIYLKDFGAKVYCSYYPLESYKQFENLVGDAFEIASQINRRSDYMEERKLRNPEGVSGLMFKFKGAAASPAHFYLSDTSNHFLKGALYFNTEVKPDSLFPIAEYLLEDLEVMIESFNWK